LLGWTKAEFGFEDEEGNWINWFSLWSFNRNR
jgi:hypothetical protein